MTNPICPPSVNAERCEYVGLRGRCRSNLAGPVPIWRDGAYLRVSYYCPMHRDLVVDRGR